MTVLLKNRKELYEYDVSKGLQIHYFNLIHLCNEKFIASLPIGYKYSLKLVQQIKHSKQYKQYIILISEELFEYSADGNLDKVTELLSYGAYVKCENATTYNYSDTDSLEIAIEYNQLHIVNYILNNTDEAYILDYIFFHIVDSDTWEYYEMIKLLLTYMVKNDEFLYYESNVDSILSHAVRMAGNSHFINLLLDETKIWYPYAMKVLNVNRILYNKTFGYVNRYTEYDYMITSPFYRVCETGDIEILDILLKHNVTPFYEGVFLAAQNGFLNIVKIFINNENVNHVLKNKTIIMFAIISENIELIDYLINCGADLSFTNGDNLTPITFAQEIGKIDVYNHLLTKL